MVQAAQGEDGRDGQDGRSGRREGAGGLDIDDLLEQIEQCIFEMADGDITKYEIIGRMPGDLFFKWLRWRRRDERRRMEWEAALHGVRLNLEGMASEPAAKKKDAATGERLADVVGNFKGKMVFERVKISKEEKARRMEEMKRKKTL